MSPRLTSHWGAVLAAVAAGCGPKHASFVQVSGGALGRVVIYRNGVAFYERRALVEDGALTVNVPRDRVDDFLKSLTVVDAKSGRTLSVSIPRHTSDDGKSLAMHLQVPGAQTAEVVLTYVTESAAWKPSYRVVVGDHKDVLLEGWAVVDNTSGEDWRDVLIGVGSSSALSFRYDLWSVRTVERETLAAREKFAVAPPTGVTPYTAVAAAPASSEVVLGELGDDEIRRPPGHPAATTGEGAMVGSETIEVTGRAPEFVKNNLAQSASVIDSSDLQPSSINNNVTNSFQRVSPARSSDDDSPRRRRKKTAEAAKPADNALGDLKVRQLASALNTNSDSVVVQSNAIDASAAAVERARDRASIVRNRLIDNGVAPARITVATEVEPGASERVRLVTKAASPSEPAAVRRDASAVDARPEGESHFANTLPMTVAGGASAMVSLMHLPTDGEIVYLYDAESERGNTRFAFRAVRFTNPTDSTLEAGPVTVYGHQRFIGEGLTEPVPPRASAVVPFALDRQIVVERKDSEDDRVSRLLTLSRGVLTAEVQHLRRRRFAVTNRLGQDATLFVRHTVAKGWTLLEAPKSAERIGEAHLFKIHLGPHEVQEVVIAEATPIERKLDLAADVTLEMMKLWVEAPDGDPALKESVRKLLAQHRALVDLAQAQDSLRRRLVDYRERVNELQRQIVSLQAAKTGGELMTHLRGKMKDVSELVQRTTIQIVDHEEKILLARVRFRDGLSELALPDATRAVASSPSVPPAKPEARTR